MTNRQNPMNRRTGEPDFRGTDSGTRIENLILLRIPDEEYSLIRPHLEFLEIRAYQRLHEPGERLEYAYFPNRGMISIVLEISDGRTLEVGVVTKKGFVGGPLAVGQRTNPYRMICQPPGVGLRIKAEALQEILPSTPHLPSRLSRFPNIQFLLLAHIP